MEAFHTILQEHPDDAAPLLPFAERRPILEHRELTRNVWQMTVAYEQPAVPGQFVNLYLDSPDLLLPRPISVCDQTDGRLTLVYAVVGAGTERLAEKVEGNQIRISQPLGRGYDLAFVRPDSSALLVGGGLGVPPLVYLARRLIENGASVVAALGFRENPFLERAFTDLGARVETIVEPPFRFSERVNGGAVNREDFEAVEQKPTGRVTDLLTLKELTGDACFSCGPKAMLKAVTDYLAKAGRPVQVSLEERMGCGYGACVGCVCPTHDPDGRRILKKVCLDGPVFWGSEVIWDA